MMKRNHIRNKLAVFAFIFIVAVGLGVLSAPAKAQSSVDSKLKQELAKDYPNAKIELSNDIHWTSSAVPSDVSTIHIRSQSPRGEVTFSVQDQSGDSAAEGWCTFSAWVQARVAVKRVLPGQPVTEDQFRIQDVNLASGMAHEYRGVILEPNAKLASLETRQTIIEGQILLSSAVQRIPDVRRGDAVRIQVISGELTLTTAGTAEEPAYLNGRVRVIAGKAKKELVGKLTQAAVVEVTL